MAKRKNSTALFEVMAAHRARQGQSAAADGPAAEPRPGAASGSGLSSGGGSAAPGVVGSPFPASNTGRSYAPPPGQLVKSASRPGLMSAGKKWLGAAIERRRQDAAAAAAAAAMEASEAEASDPSDPTAGVTAELLAARAARPAAPPPTSAPTPVVPPAPTEASARAAPPQTVEATPTPAAEPEPIPAPRSAAAAKSVPVSDPAPFASRRPSRLSASAPAAALARPPRGNPFPARSIFDGLRRTVAAAVAARSRAWSGDGSADEGVYQAGSDQTVAAQAAPDPSAGKAGRAGVDGHAARRNKVLIDREKHEVRLRVRFMTAGIGLTAVLVVVGLAYLLGKWAGSPAATAAANQKAQAGKPQAGVLDPRAGGKAAARGGAKAGGDAAGGSASAADAMSPVQPSSNGGTTSQISPGLPYEDAPISNSSARRTVGLNYCVIQTYPPELQETAMEVSQFLTANGVPNTIEIGSAENRCIPGWFVLAGTRGFTRIAVPEYSEYLQQIQQVAAKFPQKSKFGKPVPMPVKWRAP